MKVSGIAVVLGVGLALTGCSATTPPTPSPSATSDASATQVTKDEWLASLGSQGVAATDLLLAEPGAVQWIDIIDDSGMTALLYAADAGDADAVAHLLDAGADPLWRDRHQPARGPIHIAAAKGDLAVLQVLLDHGVDVDALDGAGGGALLWAGYKGQLAAAQMLLDAGADPTIVDATGMNAAERAADAGYPEVAAVIQAAIDGD